jgi:hypothetical protein
LGIFSSDQDGPQPSLAIWFGPHRIDRWLALLLQPNDLGCPELETVPFPLDTHRQLLFPKQGKDTAGGVETIGLEDANTGQDELIDRARRPSKIGTRWIDKVGSSGLEDCLETFPGNRREEATRLANQGIFTAVPVKIKGDNGRRLWCYPLVDFVQRSAVCKIQPEERTGRVFSLSSGHQQGETRWTTASAQNSPRLDGTWKSGLDNDGSGPVPHRHTDRRRRLFGLFAGDRHHRRKGQRQE